jgi:hypothetical protein
LSIPSREARLAHAAQHCELWNAKRKSDWIDSWRTIVDTDEVIMFDPVGTEAKRGFDHFTSYAYDIFRPFLEMYMVTVKVNGNEMAWVIESHFKPGDKLIKSLSIETFQWLEDGSFSIKTYYDMPDSVGENDDPYKFLLGGRT